MLKQETKNIKVYGVVAMCVLHCCGLFGVFFGSLQSVLEFMAFSFESDIYAIP
jgi:hypothetical protein